MRAGGDGLGQFDLPVGLVEQLKTKARPLAAANQGEIACRKGDAGANGNRSRLSGGCDGGGGSKYEGKDEPESQDLPFPSMKCFSMCTMGSDRPEPKETSRCSLST
jgi:hypothetical protein